jgi:hypothetical protein
MVCSVGAAFGKTGVGFMGLAFVGLPRSGSDAGGQGVTFGNSPDGQMEFLPCVSIPERGKIADSTGH